MIRVLIWNEYRREKIPGLSHDTYPEGIHKALADALGTEEDFRIDTACLDDPDCGITSERLAETDVLLFWAHKAHSELPDKVAEQIRDAVLEGMGAIFLHSAHHSKPFRLLMGTSCNLTWRESGDEELLWVIDPAHPITRHIDRFFRLPHEETYGEPFVIPNPDKVLLIGSYSGGEVFRSGVLYERGCGKIFYFQPGHETFPTFYDPTVIQLLKNAIRYLVPAYRGRVGCPLVGSVNDESYVKVDH